MNDEAAIKEMEDERAALGLPESESVEEPTKETPEEPAKPAETDEEKEPKPEEVSDKEPEEKFDFKDAKDYKKQLREELQSDFDQKLEKAIEELRKENTKAKPDETATENLEEEIAKLAEEKEIDPEVLSRIIEVARKGVQQSPEDKALLEEVKVMQQEREEREQKDIFETEWKGVLPSLKEQFPNASEEQLTKAKEQIDELSHSEKYHDKDMDYVVFKEKEAIGKTLFSPKKSTFESARPVSHDENDEFPDIRTDMSPAEFEKAEKTRAKFLDSMDSPKLRVTSRDDGGRVVERYE